MRDCDCKTREESGEETSGEQDEWAVFAFRYQNTIPSEDM